MHHYDLDYIRDMAEEREMHDRADAARAAAADQDHAADCDCDGCYRSPADAPVLKLGIGGI